MLFRLLRGPESGAGRDRIGRDSRFGVMRRAALGRYAARPEPAATMMARRSVGRLQASSNCPNLILAVASGVPSCSEPNHLSHGTYSLP